jgi:Histidine kinase-, DNA gyrase B-, and HSP90-like ATPase
MSNGRIAIVVRRCEAPAQIEVSVIDNGPGIAAAVAERLFYPLTTSKSDGLGLGLLICASIVGAHGSTNWVGGVYFGDAKDAADLTTFWNLRAAGNEIEFAPLADLFRLEQMIKAHLDVGRSPTRNAAFGSAPWRRTRWSCLERDTYIPKAVSR